MILMLVKYYITVVLERGTTTAEKYRTPFAYLLRPSMTNVFPNGSGMFQQNNILSRVQECDGVVSRLVSYELRDVIGHGIRTPSSQLSKPHYFCTTTDGIVVRAKVVHASWTENILQKDCTLELEVLKLMQRFTGTRVSCEQLEEETVVTKHPLPHTTNCLLVYRCRCFTCILVITQFLLT